MCIKELNYGKCEDRMELESSREVAIGNVVVV